MAWRCLQDPGLVPLGGAAAAAAPGRPRGPRPAPGLAPGGASGAGAAGAKKRRGRTEKWGQG